MLYNSVFISLNNLSNVRIRKNAGKGVRNWIVSTFGTIDFDTISKSHENSAFAILNGITITIIRLFYNACILLIASQILSWSLSCEFLRFLRNIAVRDEEIHLFTVSLSLGVDCVHPWWEGRERAWRFTVCLDVSDHTVSPKCVQMVECIIGTVAFIRMRNHRRPLFLGIKEAGDRMPTGEGRSQ